MREFHEFGGHSGRGPGRGYGPRAFFGPEGHDGFRRGRGGFGGERHGGKGGFGGGRGGRIFGHGGLRLVLLKLIEEKPRHGYELIKEIEERLGGSYSPSPGVVYPTLTMLEEQGFISREAEDGARKLYAITPEGIGLLAENAEQVQALFARMSQPRARHGRHSPQIVRAIRNLRTAIDLRLAREDLTEDQVNAIAATLDSAAQAVERA